MASIIQPSDFKGENLIPDMNIVAQNVQSFIDKYEPIFLRKLLGAELYTAYVADPSEVRFTDLLPYVKLAIVDYVYWQYQQFQNTQTFGAGEGKSQKQNATNASVYPKMVRAWNEMVDYNRETNKYLKDNAATYPEYTIVVPMYWEYWHECDRPEIYRYKNSLGL